MPSIKRSEYPQHDEFSALMSRCQYLGDNNACVPIAFSAITGWTFDKSAALFSIEAKREKGKGVNASAWLRIFQEQAKLTRIDPLDFIDQYPGVHKGLKSVTTHHPDRFPKVWRDGKTYLFHCSGHLACVKDGKVIDWSRGRALRAIAIYLVEEK